MRKTLRACIAGARTTWSVLAGSLLASGIFTAGCTGGPNYKRPSASSTIKWDLAEPWRESDPKDSIPKGQWWTVFHDEDLNTLEAHSLDDNQILKIAIARLEQARAVGAIQV